MSRVAIMSLHWYTLGFGKMGRMVIDGPFPDMDSADDAGLKFFGFQQSKRHRNYIIFAEWSRDLSATTEKVAGIFSKDHKRGT
jgi:hypothetical protein